MPDINSEAEQRSYYFCGTRLAAPTQFEPPQSCCLVHRRDLPRRTGQTGDKVQAPVRRPWHPALPHPSSRNFLLTPDPPHPCANVHVHDGRTHDLTALSKLSLKSALSRLTRTSRPTALPRCLCSPLPSGPPPRRTRQRKVDSRSTEHSYDASYARRDVSGRPTCLPLRIC